MAESVRTWEQLEDVFRTAIRLILGIPMEDNKTVRFPWGSNTEAGSAPAFSRTANVVTIYALPADDPQNRQRHISYQDDGGDKLTYVDEHTDVHQVQFVCYGPKAFEWSRAIRDGMCWPEVKSIFQQASLYYVPDIPAPVPAPELVEGSWWTRFDVRVAFNEGVRIERLGVIDAIEQVKIKAIPADTPSTKVSKQGKGEKNGSTAGQ